MPVGLFLLYFIKGSYEKAAKIRKQKALTSHATCQGFYFIIK